MNKIFDGPVIPTLIKLAFLSFIVGLALYFARIDPIDLWQDFGETVRQAWRLTLDFFEWGAKYMALGAIVVVPIWVVFRLWKALMGSRKPPPPEAP